MRTVFNLGDVVGEQNGETWVLTNSDNWRGAYEWITEPSAIREVMKEHGLKKAWIIPSSKHELLLTPMGEFSDYEEMQRMHREVQKQTVAIEDRLSDNVWYMDEVAFHMTIELLKGER